MILDKNLLDQMRQIDFIVARTQRRDYNPAEGCSTGICFFHGRQRYCCDAPFEELMKHCRWGSFGHYEAQRLEETNVRVDWIDDGIIEIERKIDLVLAETPNRDYNPVIDCTNCCLHDHQRHYCHAPKKLWKYCFQGWRGCYVEAQE